MSNYNFDIQNDMKNKETWKWDKEGAVCKYPLGVADTDYVPPKEIIEAVVSKASQGNFAYGVLSEQFNESIVSWYKKRHNSFVNSKWISSSPGLITGIKLFMDAVTHQGDNIIIQSPVYFNFSLIIERNGRKILENTLLYKNGKYEIDFEDLEKKAADPRTTMMILCNPHNPIAFEWDKEDLKKIATICNKHNVFVISDEAHSDILHKGIVHTPFISLDSQTANNSATINSPGKAFNINGLYVSYVIIPNERIKAAYDIAYANHHFDFSTIGSTALIAAYTYGEQYVNELNEYIEENVKYLRKFLAESMPEVKMTKANSTYLMWLDFNAWHMNSDEVDEFFRSAGIALNKGNIYGKAGDGFMRINIGCTKKILKEALDSLLLKYQEKFKK